jgi:hypothetical protein
LPKWKDLGETTIMKREKARARLGFAIGFVAIAAVTSFAILVGGRTPKGIRAEGRMPKGTPQMFSTYSDFQAMSLEQLKTLQVKLTYVGAQLEPISTVAFTSSFNTLELAKFVPFRRPGIHYGNDNSGVQTFAATPEELKAIIDNVGTLPNITAGGVASDPFLSFALFNSAGSDKAFEAVLNQADALSLFDKLRLALQNNKIGSRIVAEMACPLDLIGTGRPTDVTTNVTIIISGTRLNRNTGRFVSTATVKNTSTTSILGPISLVLGFQGNVSLFNSDGHTCGITPVGQDFINLALPGGVLPANGSVQVVLEFNSPDKESIKPTTKVLAGPGAR